MHCAPRSPPPSPSPSSAAPRAPRPASSSGHRTAASFAYETASLAFAGEHVVVHWVARGSYAPALNDDDGNGVPDYVEQVASAADAALDFYVAARVPRCRCRTAPARTRGRTSTSSSCRSASSATWRRAAFSLERPVRRPLGAPRPARAGGAREPARDRRPRALPRRPAGVRRRAAAVGGGGDGRGARRARRARGARLRRGAAADALGALARAARSPRTTRTARAPSGSSSSSRHPGLVAALLERRARMTPFAAAADPSWYATLDAVFRARDARLARRGLRPLRLEPRARARARRGRDAARRQPRARLLQPALDPGAAARAARRGDRDRHRADRLRQVRRRTPSCCSRTDGS